MRGFDGRKVGSYGYAVRTTTIRVPAGSEEAVRSFLKNYSKIREKWEQKASHTRNWTEYHRFCEELDQAITPWPSVTGNVPVSK